MEYFCQNPWLSIKSTVIHWKENNEAWQLWTRGKLEDASLSYKYHHCPSLISKTEKHKSMLVLIYTHKGERESCSVVSDSLWPHGLYNPWNSLGQNTGVDNLSLLQRIFPSQVLNPGLPHCRQILYHLSHKGSPMLAEFWFNKILLSSHSFFPIYLLPLVIIYILMISSLPCPIVIEF